jgi:hypothetical protein
MIESHGLLGLLSSKGSRKQNGRWVLRDRDGPGQVHVCIVQRRINHDHCLAWRTRPCSAC